MARRTGGPITTAVLAVALAMATLSLAVGPVLAARVAGGGGGSGHALASLRPAAVAPVTVRPSVDSTNAVRYSVVTTWGVHWPDDLAVGPDGNIYVAALEGNGASITASVKVFTPAGAIVREWAAALAPAYDAAIAVDAAGIVYLVDSWKGTVKRFSSTGTPLGEWGSKGSAPGQLDRPYGIAVDASQTVWIADTFNQRIQAFTTAGSLLGSFASFTPTTTPIGFGQVYDVAVDATPGHVYAVDTRYVVKTNGAGDFLRWFGVRDGDTFSPARPGIPTALAVDPLGRVIVSDSNWSPGNPKFHVYEGATGDLLAAWGTSGSDADPYTFEKGVQFAYDRDGFLYVADNMKNRIVRFGEGVGTRVGCSASRSRVRYGSAVTLSGALTDVSGTPAPALATAQLGVQASAGGATWSHVATVTASGGAYSYAVKPSRTTRYRAVFGGVPRQFVPSTSASVTANCQVVLTTPALSTARPRRNRRFSCYGHLTPRHAPRARSVTLRLQQLRAGRWVTRKTVGAVNANASGGRTRYAASVALAAGRWRASAAYRTNAQYSGVTTGYRTFTVR